MAEPCKLAYICELACPNPRPPLTEVPRPPWTSQTLSDVGKERKDQTVKVENETQLVTKEEPNPNLLNGPTVQSSWAALSRRETVMVWDLRSHQIAALTNRFVVMRPYTRRAFCKIGSKEYRNPFRTKPRQEPQTPPNARIEPTTGQGSTQR